ncbi:MAG: aminotransferase class V-fold PLP-dependent enzyme [Bacteroidota bacterium]
MPQDRRRFLQKLSSLTGAAFLTPTLLPAQSDLLAAQLRPFDELSPEEAARDESYWAQIQQAYTSSPNLINLNNAGVSPQTADVQAKVQLYNQFSNEAPGYYMWRTLGRIRPVIKRKLARLGDCRPDELAIMRNATEALETIIMGMDLQPGDEILTTEQDYPSMLNTLEMRVRRNGIKLKKIKLPVPIENKNEILRHFAEAITPNTKALLFCHIINMTGQVLPVKALCQLARERGIYSIVDGAHSFAHLDFSISDLGCDFFATSLHKWLSAPFGTGMLWIKADLISDIWPLHGYPEAEHDKISKFEHLGTRPFPNELAISEAIDFHDLIGTPRKEARLRYLREYWISKLKEVEGFRLLSPSKKEFSCGIGTFQLENWDPVKLSSTLVNYHQIYVTAFPHEAVQGVRISPHIYTSLKDLDLLVEAVKKIAAESKKDE